VATPARSPAAHEDPEAVHFAEARIVDASGAPVAGLAVRLTRADGVIELARTNADGVARWDRVPPGEHKIDLAQDDVMLEAR
jgi:hypothetical protein